MTFPPPWGLEPERPATNWDFSETGGRRGTPCSPFPIRLPAWRNLADATDSKSVVREDVRVRVPPRAHPFDHRKSPLSAPERRLRGFSCFCPSPLRFPRICKIMQGFADLWGIYGEEIPQALHPPASRRAPTYSRCWPIAHKANHSTKSGYVDRSITVSRSRT